MIHFVKYKLLLHAAIVRSREGRAVQQILDHPISLNHQRERLFLKQYIFAAGKGAANTFPLTLKSFQALFGSIQPPVFATAPREPALLAAGCRRAFRIDPKPGAILRPRWSGWVLRRRHWHAGWHGRGPAPAPAQNSRWFVLRVWSWTACARSRDVNTAQQSRLHAQRYPRGWAEGGRLVLGAVSFRCAFPRPRVKELNST